MSIYRITFIKNQVATCVKTVPTTILGEKAFHIEQNRGQIIFALVKAKSKKEALELLKKIPREHSRQKK
jgi:hypothetical protein